MNQSDLYELQWNNHSKILKNTFDNFRNDNELVDVTLSCEGKKIKAHKVVLSACSEYFLDLFRDNPCQHPIIIMRDISYEAMENILNFMYMGELNIAVEQLNSFLKIAECLQVKGLAVEVAKDENVSTQSNSIQQPKDSEKVNRKTKNNNQDTYHKNPKTFKYSNNALEQMQKETMENKEKIITNVCKTEQLSGKDNFHHQHLNYNILVN